MRTPGVLRSLLTTAAALLLSSCGSSSSPTAPTGVTPQTGVQVLRVSLASATCPGPNVTIGLLGLLYTRVQVSQSASEWIATSADNMAGNVEIRLARAGASPTGAAHWSGTIIGTARHIPELLPSVPAWESLIDFGSDRRTVLDAYSFSVIGKPDVGVDGIGTGTITTGNSAGPQCSGTQFSFTVGPDL